MAASTPWAATTDKVLKAHKVSQDEGLTDDQVTALREKYGPNELDKEEGTPLWQLVLDQFDDLLVKILLGAACLSFALAFAEEGDDFAQAMVEPFVILLILIINAIVGVWQEHNAENALEALKNLQNCAAQVIRNGTLNPDLPASELVPGDIVRVRVGDKVPADIRLVKLDTTSVRTDEGALTGESETVLKTTEPVAKSARIQDKKNMLFSGTTVSNGTCVGVVVATGMKTEIGVIQSQVQQAAEEEEKTPLGQKIDAFGELLAKVIAYICLAVWIMNYKQFSDPVHGTYAASLRICIYMYLYVCIYSTWRGDGMRLMATSASRHRRYIYIYIYIIFFYHRRLRQRHDLLPEDRRGSWCRGHSRGVAGRDYVVSSVGDAEDGQEERYRAQVAVRRDVRLYDGHL